MRLFKVRLENSNHLGLYTFLEVEALDMGEVVDHVHSEFPSFNINEITEV